MRHSEKTVLRYRFALQLSQKALKYVGISRISDAVLYKNGDFKAIYRYGASPLRVFFDFRAYKYMINVKKGCCI